MTALQVKRARRLPGETHYDAYQKFAAQQRTIKENVEWLLNRFPYLKKSPHVNKLIVWYYWFYIDNLPELVQDNMMIRPEDFGKLTPNESITRIYRAVVPIEERPPVVLEREFHYRKYYGRR